jgi:hypothetical protein
MPAEPVPLRHDGGDRGRRHDPDPIREALRDVLAELGVGQVGIEPLWRAEHVARFLDVSADVVYDLVQAERLPHVRLPNGRLRFESAVIREWATQQRRTPRPVLDAEQRELERLAPTVLKHLRQRRPPTASA